ncbi:phosphopantothenoylcysteine decarboxylase [Erysipelothrix urinaevulpis]|uniref:phosphopantothenoylcysteine decarboxylase domain-containing protein n=1 Tax=Erysipelothrix urinaevulpis TaxID=2683717 RepID=UPI0013589841|nr:phosphopantothenoylcysteine decarboxylase [Erysipelothrix urinaevulpis]
MRKILITAGGTEEKIDAVRSITNTASGTLGSIIADRFIELGYDVVYVHGSNAALPTLSCQTIEVYGVQDLELEILKILKQEQFSLIVHAMAISDFYIESMYQNNDPLPVGSGKISSDYPVQLTLAPAPKIINHFKQYSEGTLIGFKLLANASDSDLLNASIEQIKKAKSDFVIANHKEFVSVKNHKAYLCDETGFIQTFTTKEEIAQGIIDVYLKRGTMQ